MFVTRTSWRYARGRGTWRTTKIRMKTGKEFSFMHKAAGMFLSNVACQLVLLLLPNDTNLVHLIFVIILNCLAIYLKMINITL